MGKRNPLYFQVLNVAECRRYQAGAVRAKANQRNTTSDWMEIERQRGISISSNVLQFKYKGIQINLLDTPGHKDFSEDTYIVGLLDTSGEKSEYGVDIKIERLGFVHARWVEGTGLDADFFERRDDSRCLEDRDGQPVLLFKSDWALRWAEDNYKALKFLKTAPMARSVE